MSYVDHRITSRALTAYRQGTVEEKAVVNVKAGKSLDIYVEYTNTPPPDSTQTDMSQPGLMLGAVSIPLNSTIFG